VLPNELFCCVTESSLNKQELCNKKVTQIVFRVLHGKANSKCNIDLWPTVRTVAVREYQMVIRITSAVKNLQLLRSAVYVQLVGKVCNELQVSVLG